MRLRIVAGSLKGRVITLGGHAQDCRPTLERQRESVAQILGWRVNGARVADLCAGSGAFGFEMISRGAREVDFVEVDKARARAIGTCAETFKVRTQCNVWCEDIRRFLRRGCSGYDIVYFDPPYEDAALAELVPQVLAVLGPDGVAVHERAARSTSPNATHGQIRLVDTRAFGMTTVDLYAALPLRNRPTPVQTTPHASLEQGDLNVDSDLPGNI